MSFDIVEDTLIALTKEKLTNSAGQAVYQAVEAVPGDLDDADTIKEMVKVAPSVYWAFLGGRPGVDSSDIVAFNGVWVAFMVVQHAGDYMARLRGDTTTIGLYEMTATLLPEVNGYTIAGVGTMKFRRLQNLFRMNMDKTGVQVYAASFELQQSFEPAAGALDGFITYHAEHSMAPGTDEPAAVDDLTLDQ